MASRTSDDAIDATRHATRAPGSRAPSRPPADAALASTDVLVECSAALAFAALGAIPCVLMGSTGPSAVRLAHAAAGGAVVATASALGIRCGAGRSIGNSFRRGPGHDLRLLTRPADDAKARGLPAVVAVLSHAASEGLALGLAYAKSPEDGRIARLSVLAHNVPEGLATAAVLRSRGVSAPTCVLAALLAVVPQPLSAMAAFSFASRMAALQTVFVGFAAGLMLMIALTELLPDALSSPSKKNRDVSAAVACLAAVACVCGSSALMGGTLSIVACVLRIVWSRGVWHSRSLASRTVAAVGQRHFPKPDAAEGRRVTIRRYALLHSQPTNRKLMTAPMSWSIAASSSREFVRVQRNAAQNPRPVQARILPSI